MAAAPRPPEPVRLLVGMISADEDRFAEVRRRLEPDFGPVDLESETFPFDFTDYYEEETGSPLLRRFLSFERLMDPGELAAIKLRTNALEAEIAAELRAQNPDSPPRPVNIDPGYVAPEKLVLATMKDRAHRVYLRDGVHAEVTLEWHGGRTGRFAPREWTFPDFASGRSDGFRRRVRERLREAGREWGAGERTGTAEAAVPHGSPVRRVAQAPSPAPADTAGGGCATHAQPGAAVPHRPLYRTFSSYLRETFGERVRKIPLDAGFTCPNRDGTKGIEGCLFCNNDSFRPPRGAEEDNPSIAEQLARRTERSARGGVRKYIAYFQSYSNTYAPPERLRVLYEEALRFPGVVGLAVGTRPDCLGDEVVSLLAGLASRTHLRVELGLQTAHDATREAMSCGYTWEDFAGAVGRLRSAAPGTLLGVHLILGLPGETGEMMRETAARLAALRPDAVKLHPLYVAEGTPLAEEGRAGRVGTLAAEEYAALVADLLERLPEETVIERLSADLGNELVLAPKWDVDKGGRARMVEAELAGRGTRQGSSRGSSAAGAARGV